jgi:hypothetical protein
MVERRLVKQMRVGSIPTGPSAVISGETTIFRFKTASDPCARPTRMQGSIPSTATNVNGVNIER